MAWETRQGRRYYYRLQRVRGRVQRRYFGAGPDAVLAAAKDRQARAERDAQRQEVRAEQARLGAAIASAEELDAKADLLTQATLVLVGYHQHDRGNWRRRRHDGEDEG